MDDVLRLALVERRPARRYRRLAHMHRAVGEAAPEILRAVGDRVARLQPLFLQEARRHGGDQRGIEGGEAREHDVDLGQGGPSSLTIDAAFPGRSEEHTSELQSLMRISYAVFCW